MKQRSSVAWGRVLVCDDNLMIADVVAEFLRECAASTLSVLSAGWKAPCIWLESARSMA